MPPVPFRPLGRWPGEATPSTHRNSPAQFRTPMTKTLDELTTELDMLNARDPVVLVDVELHEIGPRGGLLREPKTPGVVLEFEQRVKGQGDTWAHATYPCDTYWTWQANLRAIVLTLRALRAVERYGAAGKGQQYRGFLALGAGNGAPPSGGVNTAALQLSPERAAGILSDVLTELAPWSRDAIFRDLLDRSAERAAYRANLIRNARVHASPDRSGSEGLAATVNAAADVLARLDRTEKATL